MDGAGRRGTWKSVTVLRGEERKRTVLSCFHRGGCGPRGLAPRGAGRWVRLSWSRGASGLPSGGSVVGAGDEMKAWLAVARVAPPCPPEAGERLQQPSRFTEKGRPGTVGQLDSEPGLTTGCTPGGSARCCSVEGSPDQPPTPRAKPSPIPTHWGRSLWAGAWSAGVAGPRLPGPAPRVLPEASGEEVPGTRCGFPEGDSWMGDGPQGSPVLWAGGMLCPCQGHLPGWVGKSGLPSLGGSWRGALRGPELA